MLSIVKSEKVVAVRGMGKAEKGYGERKSYNYGCCFI
jgi:hypothetical protein